MEQRRSLVRQPFPLVEGNYMATTRRIQATAGGKKGWGIAVSTTQGIKKLALGTKK
jgi:hypothetical protein